MILPLNFIFDFHLYRAQLFTFSNLLLRFLFLIRWKMCAHVPGPLPPPANGIACAEYRKLIKLVRFGILDLDVECLTFDVGIYSYSVCCWVRIL